MMPHSDTPAGQNGRLGLSGRAQRAIYAGLVVGGATIGGLLAAAVLIRLLSDYLGWAVLVGICLFGVGAAIATAIFDWLLE